MTRYSLIVWILLPAGAFAIAFAYLQSQQRAAEQRWAAAEVAGRSAPLPVAPIALPAGSAVSLGAPVQAPVAPISAPAPPPSTLARGGNLAPLEEPRPPVKLLIRPARDGAPALATVLNTSADATDVTLTAVNPKTHLRSVAQATVLPHERHAFGSEGLTLAPGDEVTLSSPPFPDQVVTAR